jgi:hypothetical protein
MASIIRSISIDENVYNEARKILKEELNMTMSKYLEIQLRALVRSKTQTQKDLYEGVVSDLLSDMMKPKVAKKKKK